MASSALTNRARKPGSGGSIFSSINGSSTVTARGVRLGRCTTMPRASFASDPNRARAVSPPSESPRSNCAPTSTTLPTRT
ncbi:hypothetical protein, partial [Corallococcus exiguus]|uniref:hypothetical protein n=1 Tax=Corallococcus exiguus TaxID=83462 RepID=UPI001C60A090